MPGAELKILIDVGSFGPRNGRNESGTWKTWSSSVVLNMTVVVPVMRKRLPMPGMPMSFDCPVENIPATPGV